MDFSPFHTAEKMKETDLDGSGKLADSHTATLSTRKKLLWQIPVIERVDGPEMPSKGGVVMRV